MTARIVWCTLGWVALGLGLVGVLLPVMPTTPFILLAAYAFGRGSPVMRQRLERHQHFGPIIRDWEERGAIRRRHKALACLLMGASFLGALLLGIAPRLLLLQGSVMGAAALYVLTRPSADR